jgi:hypothetical protein
MKKLFLFPFLFLLAGTLAAQVDSNAMYKYWNAKAGNQNRIVQDISFFCTNRGGGIDTIKVRIFTADTSFTIIVPSVPNAIRAYVRDNYLNPAKVLRSRYNDSADVYK